jgi:hypothetical protein
MPHTSTKGRAFAAAASLILLPAALGLAACGSSGGSSSTPAQTAANAAATGTPTTGAKSTGTTPSGTSSNGTSSTGTTPTTPAGQPNATRYNAVRECLAQKSIVLPPRTNGAAGLVAGGENIKVPKGMSHTQLAEALRACNIKYAGSHVPRSSGSAGAGHPLPARFHHVLARFAACLRQNGVPVGEPNTSGKGPIFNAKGINTGSPQFRAAAAKCRTALFGTPPRKAGSGSTTATG